MAQFKISTWTDFPSAYSVIVEIEKKWTVSARATGKTYIITTTDQELANQLRTMTQLEGKAVTLEELLPEDKQCTYVVTRVPLDIPNEAIMARIASATEVERLMILDRETRKKCPSNSVKVRAKGEIPTEIRLGALGKFLTRPYIPDPTRCYKCQNYGHMQKDCHRGIRCALCSLNHSTEECRKKLEKNEEVTKKCANCGGKHASGAMSCPVRRKKAQETKTRFLGSISQPKPDQQQAPTPPVNNTNNFPSMTQQSQEAPKTTQTRQKETSPKEEIIQVTTSYLRTMMRDMGTMILQLTGHQDKAPELELLIDGMMQTSSPPTTKRPVPWTTSPAIDAKAGTPADKYIKDNKLNLKRPLEENQNSSGNKKPVLSDSDTQRTHNGLMTGPIRTDLQMETNC